MVRTLVSCPTNVVLTFQITGLTTFQLNMQSEHIPARVETIAGILTPCSAGFWKVQAGWQKV